MDERRRAGGDRRRQGETGATGAVGPAGRDAVELLPRKVKMAFLILGLVATLSLTAIGFVAAENRRLAKEGKEAHDVLCVVRENDKVRLARANDLLKKQSGDTIEIFGLQFPRDEIIRTQMQAETALKASEALDCQPPPPPTTSTVQQTTIK